MSHPETAERKRLPSIASSSLPFRDELLREKEGLPEQKKARSMHNRGSQEPFRRAAALVLGCGGKAGLRMVTSVQWLRISHRE
jgi:hypothetical protein